MGKCAHVAYVLGSNPPLSIMEGYFKRIWEKWGIDQIVVLKKGIFIVRFHTLENKTNAMVDGVKMFDEKPLIIQPWGTNMDLRKTNVERVPIWVRFPDFDTKFWVQSSLTKIAAIIGKPIKPDRATTEKEMLNFARVLIEALVKQDFLDTIEFLDQWEYEVIQKVKYEWKPIHCTNCGGMGHDTEKCKKLLGMKRIWYKKWGTREKRRKLLLMMKASSPQEIHVL